MSQNTCSDDSKAELPDGIQESVYPDNGNWYCSYCHKWFNKEPEEHHYECIMKRLEGN